MFNNDIKSKLGYTIMQNDNGYYGIIYSPDGEEISTTKAFKTEKNVQEFIETFYKNVIVFRF